MYVGAILGVTFLTALLLYPVAIPRLIRARIVGRDVNKPDKPRIPEMGGIVIMAAFSFGLVVAMALESYTSAWEPVDNALLLTSLSAVLIMVIVGILDDLKQVSRIWKMITPILAALPLLAIRAGATEVSLPWLGLVDFGVVYPLLIVPIGMVGAANAANILGGFNGLETGLGLLSTTALAVITYTTGQFTSFVLLACMIGPLVATLFYNWYPARIFIGDVGTHPIGVVLCIAAVLGNCETAGVIVMIPHAMDFVIKLRHRMPTKGWGGEYKDGRLHCPAHGPVGLAQLVMKIFGGVGEVRLVTTILVLEAICASAAVALFAQF